MGSDAFEAWIVVQVAEVVDGVIRWRTVVRDHSQLAEPRVDAGESGGTPRVGDRSNGPVDENEIASALCTCGDAMGIHGVVSGVFCGPCSKCACRYYVPDQDPPQHPSEDILYGAVPWERTD